MYLKDRDKSIIKFVETYKSITIEQCANIFFKNCKNNYDMARKRLQILYKNAYLMRYRQGMNTVAVYYINKKLTLHELKVIDLYSKLIYKSINTVLFKTEYIIHTKDKNYRLDGFLEFEYQGYFYSFIIEIDRTHQTSKKKLKNIYQSQYFQNKYQKEKNVEIYPSIIIVKSDIKLMKYYDYYNNEYNIEFMDWDLSDINKILE